LRDTEAAEVISSELVPKDFYSASTQKAFVAIQGLVEEGLDVNPVSVSERSGLALVDLQELVDRADGVGPNQLKTLISELNRVSDLRVLYTACINASSQIGVDSKVEEATEALEKGLYQLNGGGGGADVEDGGDVIERVKRQFLEKAGKGGGPEVSTGIKELDRAIISLSGPKMVVVAARPSMGKTALASTIRRSVLAQGLGVLEFNLEMGADEIAERELAFQAQLNLRKILSAKDVTSEELERAASVAGGMYNGLWFIDDKTFNIGGMRRKARIVDGRLRRQGKRLGLVILDYIQLAGDNGDGREQAVAAISRGCKMGAKELGFPWVALSQLNRACDARDDHRPMMSDIRESGSIEQDADIIMFVYREHMYDNSFPAEEAELIIRKQRSGPTGTVHVAYNPKTVTFHDRLQQSIPTPSQESNQDGTTD
jgi:replicative DNA helicase